MRATCPIILLSLLAACPVQAKTADKAAQGKVFAIEACSACHVVQPGQKPPPPVVDPNDQSETVAPTFMDIARGHGTDKTYLRKHITDPTWPMRQQLFDEYYLDDIIAYIRSLDASVPPKHPKGASAGP
jgi:mono/diheme cytochrome c family protein